MSEAKLNWSTAKVEHSKLTVEVDGELPSGWKDSFETVARLLAGSNDWGEVTLKKDKAVCVSDVSGGSEERLRHFLESVVAQANADHAPDESEAEQPDEGDEEHQDGGEKRDEARDESGSDDEMSERFRSFAD
jgi:hypothetical protein